MSLISGYQNQSCTWLQATGNNEDGEATYAAGQAEKVRYEDHRRMFPGGVMSSARVFFRSDWTGKVGDRITYAGATYHVIGVEDGQGFASKSHRVAYVGG